MSKVANRNVGLENLGNAKGREHCWTGWNPGLGVFVFHPTATYPAHLEVGRRPLGSRPVVLVKYDRNVSELRTLCHLTHSQNVIKTSVDLIVQTPSWQSPTKCMPCYAVMTRVLYNQTPIKDFRFPMLLTSELQIHYSVLSSMCLTPCKCFILPSPYLRNNRCSDSIFSSDSGVKPRACTAATILLFSRLSGRFP